MVPTIRYCLDHLAKCVIITGTLGRVVGDYREEYTLLPIAQYLQEELDSEIHFLEDLDIDNFDEKIEDLPENSIVLLENIGFHSGEIGISCTRDGIVQHLDLDKIKSYREKLCTYCDVFINEALNDKGMQNNGNDYCSIVNPGYSSLEFAEYGVEAVLGLKLDKEIKILSGLFFEPERPFLALVGYNSLSKISTLDKIVMIYALLDVVDKVFIGGELALIFLAVTTGLKFEFDSKLTKFVNSVVSYAKDIGKELILPVDLVFGKENPSQTDPNFTWAHNCANIISTNSLNTDEAYSDGNKIIGFGELTKTKLESLLYDCRRFF